MKHHLATLSYHGRVTITRTPDGGFFVRFEQEDQRVQTWNKSLKAAVRRVYVNARKQELLNVR